MTSPDLPRLREALDELEDRVPPGWVPYNAEVTVRAAARAYLDLLENGERAIGVELIAAERRRQIEVEGWTAEHDAGHTEDGSGAEALVWAAICYATPPAEREFKKLPYFGESATPRDWPWHPKWWKPSDDRIRELEKAGALIAAEIDRLVRLVPDPEEE